MMASTPYVNAEDDPEMQDFIPKKTKPTSTNDKVESSFLQRIMLSVDERTNVKVVMNTWQPRLEFVVRLMLVATFLDDSLHTLLDFSEHLQKVNAFVLVIGTLAQIFGSLCVVGNQYIDWSTKALIAWVIVQPILYKQVSNVDLLLESCSLLGGLLLLRSHMVNDSWSSTTQLLGRLLLPAIYLYEVGFYLSEAETFDQTNSFKIFFANLSVFMVCIAIIFGLLIGACLVAVGLKSRAVAFLLALFSLGFSCYHHPFWTYIYRQDGEWKYKRSMPLPSFSVHDDYSRFDVEPSVIYALHRYYFFLGISTTAGLLFLTMNGPGKIAVQNDEVILPQVGRARD